MSSLSQTLSVREYEYFTIDIGSFNELYDTMSISRGEYPPDTYGEYRIARFGITERCIITRSTEYRSARVTYMFPIYISPALLSEAEKLLGCLLSAEDMSFPYIDTTGNQRKNLIMVRPYRMFKAWFIHQQILKLFPSEENVLAGQTAIAAKRLEARATKERHSRELRDEREARIRAELNAETEIAKHKTEIAKHKTEIGAKERDAMAARHETEILKLRLEMAEMKLALK
jgi:hypothetical protein